MLQDSITPKTEVWSTGLSGSREECYRPVHWPGKWAAISLIILGERRRGKKWYRMQGWTEGDRSLLRPFRKMKNIKSQGAKEEKGRVTKRAASWGPEGGCNRPGQHFTCVTSCWPQLEERAMAWWPAGPQGLSDWHRRLYTRQTDKHRHTCIATHVPAHAHTHTHTLFWNKCDSG